LNVTLKPHPARAVPLVRDLSASISRAASNTLAIKYVLEGTLDALRVPLERPANASERLWEHTCFELFIARPSSNAYHELNFAPYGAWAAYAFESYRVPAPGAPPEMNLQVTTRCAGTTFELDAHVDLSRLSRDYVAAELVLGVSAVVEDGEGNLSYWALAHPADKPDFHNPALFAARLK
jgi:hypothetical protein